MDVNICVANISHVKYAERICELMYISAQERGTGIAKRSPEYVAEKMIAGKAVIALAGDEFAGFSYIETWSHSRFVANSGLIIAHQFRKSGLARRVKAKVFELSRQLYPEAKIFSITTGLAVMKLNTELGFKPVTFSELTDDEEFWKGCQGCINFDVLQRNNRRMCLCTGLLYDPAEHVKEKKTAAIKALPYIASKISSIITLKK
ncbi:MAG: GNAT family N-acetyltransferase [Bacteroidales bacterium]|nr:GNAT family N-acetyltransferase [Bacteroidales bacterium]